MISSHQRCPGARANRRLNLLEIQIWFAFIKVRLDMIPSVASVLIIEETKKKSYRILLGPATAYTPSVFGLEAQP